jgi:hypothetical protein
MSGTVFTQPGINAMFASIGRGAGNTPFSQVGTNSNGALISRESFQLRGITKENGKFHAVPIKMQNGAASGRGRGGNQFAKKKRIHGTRMGNQSG